MTENGLGDDSLVRILRAIAVDNAAREEHTRATLLAMLPEKQKSAAAKRVATVIREVSYAVQHLLNALQYETFCHGLEQACKLACVHWMRIKLAQMKIEPYFSPPFDDYDWQVLPLPSFETGQQDDSDGQNAGDAVDCTDYMAGNTCHPVDNVSSTFHTDCDRVVDQEDVRSSCSNSRHVAAHDREFGVGPDETMLIVWPTMCVVDNGELKSMTQGLVISQEQVRAAIDEVRGRGRQRPGAKQARRLSMPGRDISVHAAKPF